MANIRPISDLRNKFSEISDMVHDSHEPVYLTKNGYGDMVVMSLESYEEKLFESEVYRQLKDAELEAKMTKKRVSHDELFSELRKRLQDEN